MYTRHGRGRAGAIEDSFRDCYIYKSVVIVPTAKRNIFEVSLRDQGHSLTRTDDQRMFLYTDEDADGYLRTLQADPHITHVFIHRDAVLTAHQHVGAHCRAASICAKVISR